MLEYSKLEIVQKVSSLKLQFSSRCLLSKLIEQINSDNSVTMSYKQLAILTNSHERTTARAAHQLKNLGYIDIVHNNESGKGSKGKMASTFVLSFHRITLAIRDRELEIERQLETV